MPKTVKQKRKWLSRSLWALAGIFIIFILGILAARVFVTTPSGATFIESKLNTRSLGPIERIEIKGLSGDPLGAFSAKSLKLYDQDGLWLSAKNIDMDWSPWALRRKNISIKSLEIEAADLIRKPNFPPSEGSGKEPYAIKLNNGRVDRLKLDRSIAGQAAELSLITKLDVNKRGRLSVALEAIRQDLVGDKFDVDFTREKDGTLDGDLALIGAPGGPISVLFKAPESAAIEGTGKVSGSTISGQAKLKISFDRVPKLNSTASWTADTANLAADVETQNWPYFDSLREVLDDKFKMNAKLNRQVKPSNFQINVLAQKLTAEITGRLDDDGKPPETVSVSAKTAELGSIVELPQGYTIGATQIQGQVRIKDARGFTGVIDAKHVNTPDLQASSISGPSKVTELAKSQFDISGDWTAADLRLERKIPLRLSPTTKITGVGSLNLDTKQMRKLSAKIISGAHNLSTSGNVDFANQSYQLSGAADLNLLANKSIPPGRVKSQYSLIQDSNKKLVVKAVGNFEQFSGVNTVMDEWAPDGVGFDVVLSPIKDGTNFSSLKLTASQIGVAMQGALTHEINFEGEALVSGPFVYNQVDMPEGLTSSFTISGAPDDPMLKIDALAEQIKINGFPLRETRLRAEISDLLVGPSGPVRVTAITDQGNLDLSTLASLREQVFKAENITAKWGDYAFTGDVTKPMSGPASGVLRLILPEENDRYARAELTLVPDGMEQGIILKIDAKNVVHQSLAFDSFTASAKGSAEHLNGQFDAKGRQLKNAGDQEFNIASTFSVERAEEGGYVASLNPDMHYGNLSIAAASPITAAVHAGNITVSAPLTIAGEPLDISYRLTYGAEQLTLEASNLPVTILPLSGGLADTRGRISANISISSPDAMSGFSGTGTFNLDDWRGFDAPVGTGISGNIASTLAGNRLSWTLKAQSPDGLTASGEGMFPVVSALKLAELRPDFNAPMSGQVSASGQAAALLGLLAPSDAEPSGLIKADLKLAGTALAPQIEGHITGQDLRLEAPQMGTQIRDGRFTASFTNDTLKVRDVYISDSDKGALTGGGDFVLGELGRPIGEIKLTTDNFKALSRKDVESRVSGDVTYISLQKKSRIVGDITLKQVDVKQFVSGAVKVLEIPVEEINAPESHKTVSKKPPVSPIELEIRLRAPRRIFVRSRGLDVELSADATIGGTFADPLVFGSAEVIRGGYKIAGKTMAFETGTITFDGPPSEATIDLVAITTAQNLVATVNIKGTASNPEVVLSSKPERPQDEIMSALLFDRPVTDLSVIEAAQLAGALAQFSGSGGKFDLIGGLRDALGIGQLSIGRGSQGGAQVTGGRYLAKNVYLQLFSGGGRAQTGAVIDWEVRKNISLRSKVQGDNDQAVSVKVKKDF